MESITKAGIRAYVSQNHGEILIKGSQKNAESNNIGRSGRKVTMVESKKARKTSREKCEFCFLQSPE